MASYEEILRLRIEGLGDLNRLDQLVERLTGNLDRVTQGLSKRTSITQGTAGAVRWYADSVGRQAQDASVRRGEAADRVQGYDNRIGYQARLNTQVTMRDRKLLEYQRGGGGRTDANPNYTRAEIAALEQQRRAIDQITQAWEAAGGAQIQNLGLATSLSRELRSQVENQKELNRAVGLRQSTFERSRRFDERLTTLTNGGRTPEREIGEIRPRLRDLNTEARAGNQLGVTQIQKEIEARISRLERTVKEADQSNRLGARSERLAAKLDGAVGRTERLPLGNARTLAESRLGRAGEALQAGNLPLADRLFERVNRQLDALAKETKDAGREFAEFKRKTIEANKALETARAAEMQPRIKAKGTLDSLVGIQNQLNTRAATLERKGLDSTEVRTAANRVGEFVDSRRARLEQIEKGTQVASKDFFDQIEAYAGNATKYLEAQTRRIKAMPIPPKGGGGDGGSGGGSGAGKQPSFADLEFRRMRVASGTAAQMDVARASGVTGGDSYKGNIEQLDRLQRVTAKLGQSGNNMTEGRIKVIERRLALEKGITAELQKQDKLEEVTAKKEKEKFSFASAKKRMGGIFNDVKSGKGIGGMDAENLALGAGFPLLFGGGPGTVAGGVIGSFFGGGFGGQILGGALGQIVDDLVASLAKLGNAVNLATNDLSGLREQGLQVTAADELLATQARRRGDYGTAKALVTDSIARQTGDIGGVTTQAATDAVNGLKAAWDGVYKTVSVTAGYLALGILPPLALILRGVQAVFLGVNKIMGEIVIALRLIPGLAKFFEWAGDALALMTGEYQDQLALLDKQVLAATELNDILEKVTNRKVAGVGLTGAAKIRYDAGTADLEAKLQLAQKIKEINESIPNNVKGAEGRRLAQIAQANKEFAVNQKLRQVEANFNVETANISETRQRADMVQGAYRQAFQFQRQIYDLQNAAVDLARQEADYARAVVDFRLKAENELARKRAEVAGLEIDNARKAADIQIEAANAAFDKAAYNSGDQRVSTVLDAAKNLQATIAGAEADGIQAKSQAELRVAELRRAAREADRALETERVSLERQREGIIRARVAYERQLEDYKMATADYQLDISRKIQDEVRRTIALQKAAMNEGGTVPGQVGPKGGIQSGGIPAGVKVISGWPGTAGLFDRKGHGLPKNYHDHLEFSSREMALKFWDWITKQANPTGAGKVLATELQGRGAGNTGGHRGAAHAEGRAIDIPGAQWGGRGPIGKAEYAGSQWMQSMIQLFAQEQGIDPSSVTSRKLAAAAMPVKPTAGGALQAVTGGAGLPGVPSAGKSAQSQTLSAEEAAIKRGLDLEKKLKDLRVESAKQKLLEAFEGGKLVQQKKREFDLGVANLAGSTAETSNLKEQLNLRAKNSVELAQAEESNREALREATKLLSLTEQDQEKYGKALAANLAQKRAILATDEQMLTISPQITAAGELSGIANNIRSFGAAERAGFAPGSQGGAKYQEYYRTDKKLANTAAPGLKAMDELNRRDALAKDLGSSLTQGINTAFVASINGGDVQGAFVSLLNTLSGKLFEYALRPLTDTLEKGLYNLVSPANTQLVAAGLMDTASDKMMMAAQIQAAAYSASMGGFSAGGVGDLPGLAGAGALFSGGASDTLPGLAGILAKTPADLIPLAEGGIAMGPTRALIGEGGQPEAVIPLDQLPGMLGGGSGGPVAINQNINIDNSGGGSVTSDGAGRLGAMVQQATLAVIRREQRPGGELNKRR